jgi:hypothetical protein
MKKKDTWPIVVLIENLPNACYHAHMHGLIHHGQLRGMSIVPLGLMYALRVNVRSYVTIRY